MSRFLSEPDTFAPSTCNFNIVTLDRLNNKRTRHSGDEIDLAGSEGLGSTKVDNISPRWLSQSAQDVPVAPMSCLTLAITEVISRIDHKAKVCLKIHFFVSRGVRTPCLSTRIYDEALRDICRRNLDIKRKHTPA